MTRAESRSDGILLVDKPGGCTSHDVVAQVRRVFGQREVGHAGTLDPMATGLLVVLLGEATKLSAYLTTDSKRYEATISFGIATDTLDADGAVVERVDGPPPAREAIERELAAMVGPMQQVPPVVSAIKRHGTASHVLARRGDAVDLSPRDVVLEAAAVRSCEGATCEIDLTCSKGFYVRALARDLAARLGTVGHLGALRRAASGAFGAGEAVSGTLVARASEGDRAAADEVRAALRPMREAARALRVLEVDDDAAAALRCGKALPSSETDGVVLVFGSDGDPVCIAQANGGVLRVVRGFVPRRSATGTAEDS